MTGLVVTLYVSTFFLFLCDLLSGTEDDDAGEPPYVDMIRTALLKMPGRQGNLPAVYAYIEVSVLLCRGIRDEQICERFVTNYHDSSQIITIRDIFI